MKKKYRAETIYLNVQLTKEQLEKFNEDPDMLVSITDEDVFPLRMLLIILL